MKHWGGSKKQQQQQKKSENLPTETWAMNSRALGLILV